VIVLVIPCQLCCPTTAKDPQNTPPKLVQLSVLRLIQLERTSYMSVTFFLRETNSTHSFPQRRGIRYIPEELVLTDGLLQNDDDEHLISPLLLPPWEDETNNKEGCISRGGFKCVITQASWSHKSPTQRHKTHSFGSRLSIRYSSVLMFHV
jgi:hypothetical protein